MTRPAVARRVAPRRAAALLSAAALGAATFTTDAAAQGVGSAGAELLQLSAGARAAALGGAYTAVLGDPDAVFYNPASAAWLSRAAGLGYQAYVEDVSLGSASGALAIGRVVLGGGLVFLDGGSIEEIEPDPVFGGERGRPTGREVDASEVAGRLAAAILVLDGRAAVGAAAGFVTSDMGGVGRSAPFLDLGAQARFDALTLGLALRNLGPDLSNDEYGDAPLPAQARVGGAYRHARADGLGVIATGDAVWGITEQTLAMALGLEAGLIPDQPAALTAVLRTGIVLGEADDHLGRIAFGGGLGLHGLALDYTVQAFEHLGVIHRVGVRWTR